MIDTSRMRDAVKDKNYQYMRNVWLDGSTHFSDCEYQHYPCAVLAMCDALDEAQETIRKLKLTIADLQRTKDEYKQEDK